MAAHHAKWTSLFPTRRAIPEELQIGRTEIIDAIEGMVVAGSSVLLLEERRIGKSSVALAVVNRIRAQSDQGALGIHLDLRYDTRDSAAVAKQLLSQARAQGADRRVGALLRRDKLSQVGETIRGRIREVGQSLGLEDEAAVVSSIAEAFANIEQTKITDVLTALDAYARLQDRRVIIFIDEVQELAEWSDAGDVERALAAAEGKPGSHLSFVFAGSEASSIEALFVEGRELAFVGNRVELPPISLRDWQRGLPPRFQQAGLVIAPDQVAQIHLATDGHPLKTMSVCAQILLVVASDEVSPAVVRQAIDAARAHPSWRAS